MSTLHQQVCAQVLRAHGWRMLYGHSAIASKLFDTAVGPKTAHAYLGKSDGYSHSLTGDYQSEGRNVLAAAHTLLPVGADEATLRQLVASFSAKAEAYVAQSYAVKLLRTVSPRTAGLA